MLDIITVAFLSFAPVWYTFRIQWRYQSEATTFRKFLILFAVTIATSLLFFSYIVQGNRPRYVYYLFVFATIAPLVDLTTHVYPSTGALCHITSLLFFVLIRNLSQLYQIFGGIIIGLSVIGFASTFRMRMRAVAKEIDNIIDQRSFNKDHYLFNTNW